jgi:hypothetical protein
VRASLLMFATAVVLASPAAAQEPERCRALCSPELNVEPTVTFTNLFGSPRIASDHGTTREERKAEFEVILSLVLPTRVR